MSRDISTRVWLTSGSHATYPEQTHPSSASRSATGICFSGGSTRSYVATVGQLRGLTEAGLIDRVGYLSAVSGGAWAATAYTYYPGTKDIESDIELLGAHEAPEGLSVNGLSVIDPRTLGFAATRDFAGAFAIARTDPSVPHDEVFTRSIAQTFLSPYGLFDPDRPVSFTLDEPTAQEIRDRNPMLRDVRLHTVRAGSYRPYLLIHSTLNWPEDESDFERVNRVGFEYSPLAIGSATRLTLRSDHRPLHSVGGGFVEPFAFGSAAPSSPFGAEGFVMLDLPSRPFTLADAIGASSAFRTSDRELRVYPHATYWSVGSPTNGRKYATTRGMFTDGGDIENYGLISLLRRGVRAIIVFINSVWPLSLEYDSTRWPSDLNDEHPTQREIDPFLAPLFGAPSRRFSKNWIFPEADYTAVVSRLQSAKRRGDPVMTMTTHILKANDWWGIDGGSEVRMCWFYNDQVERWTKRLPDPLQRLVREGEPPEPAGPFARFPHYLTREQNPGMLIRLTPVQVNLLAHLSCWNVIECREEVGAFLDLS